MRPHELVHDVVVDGRLRPGHPEPGRAVGACPEIEWWPLRRRRHERVTKGKVEMDGSRRRTERLGHGPGRQ